MLYKIIRGKVAELSINKEAWGKMLYVVARFQIGGVECQYIYLPEAALKDGKPFIENGDVVSVCMRPALINSSLVYYGFNETKSVKLDNDWLSRSILAIVSVTMLAPMIFFYLHQAGLTGNYNNPILKILIFAVGALSTVSVATLFDRLIAMYLILKNRT